MQSRRIGFLLMPQFSMMAFLAAMEPLRVANRFGGDLYVWRTFATHDRSVTASNGMTVMASGLIDALPELDTLVICAGFEPLATVDAALLHQMHRLAERRVRLGALDTGAYVLARAGLLNGYRVTLHWESIEAFRETFPQVAVSGELFEIDRDRFTCAGGTSALDMMLRMIADQHGWGLATQVSEQFIHERIRGADDHQRMRLRARLNIHHPRLVAAVKLMEQRIEKPLPIVRIAERSGLSTRQLRRLFEQHLDTTPRGHYLGIRLDRARQLLRQTSMNVLEVSVACGFNSPATFSRAYKQRFGAPPRDDRVEPSLAEGEAVLPLHGARGNLPPSS